MVINWQNQLFHAHNICLGILKKRSVKYGQKNELEFNQ